MPLSGPTASIVNIFTSGSVTTPLPVTSTVANPVYITGSISSISIDPSVGGTGSAPPSSATFIAGRTQAGALVGIQVDPSGAIVVSGTFSAIPSGTQAVSQTQMLVNVDEFMPGLPVRNIYQESMRGAFGGLNVVNESPVVAISFNYNVNPYFTVTSTLGGGTISTSSSMAVVSTSASPTGSAQIESRGAVRYNPGQGITARFTALFATGSNGNSIQEIGLGDNIDGFFFAMTGTSFGVISRQGGVDTFVSQSAWNGPDIFNGSGSSGAVLNPALGNVYQVRYQWLGFGSIRFFVEDPTTGFLDLVHTIRYSNSHSVPSVYNPTLPLHIRATNIGGTSNLSIMTPSMGAYHEGPAPTQSIPGGVWRQVSIGNVEEPLSSIMVTGTFQGISNRVRVRLASVSMTEDGGAGTLYAVRLRLNPTLTGSSFSAYDASSSVISVDSSSTGITNGRTVWVGVINGQSSNYCDILDNNIVIGPNDVMSVSGMRTDGTASNNVLVGLSWFELFNG